MWRTTACAVGGLVCACAAAYGIQSITPPRSNAANFDLRWLYPTAKSDRLPLAENPQVDQVTMAFHVPAERTTIAAKGSSPRRVEESALHMTRIKVRSVPINPVRTVPSDELRRKENAKRQRPPEGCEPSFSPVTTPSLAHISGRCDA